MEMILSDTIAKNEAQGQIRECYDRLNQLVGTVHDEFAIFSVSPAMFASQVGGMEYLASHDHIRPIFWTMVRYLISLKYDTTFCKIFNLPFLKEAGLSEEQISTLGNSDVNWPLSTPEKHLLHFVLKAIESPKHITRQDVQELENLGWTSRDIFEATITGARHIAIDIVANAFIRY